MATEHCGVLLTARVGVPALVLGAVQCQPYQPLGQAAQVLAAPWAWPLAAKGKKLTPNRANVR